MHYALFFGVSLSFSFFFFKLLTHTPIKAQSQVPSPGKGCPLPLELDFSFTFKSYTSLFIGIVMNKKKIKPKISIIQENNGNPISSYL